jgi:hypothetical protein
MSTFKNLLLIFCLIIATAVVFGCQKQEEAAPKKEMAAPTEMAPPAENAAPAETPAPDTE